MFLPDFAVFDLDFFALIWLSFDRPTLCKYFTRHRWSIFVQSAWLAHFVNNLPSLLAELAVRTLVVGLNFSNWPSLAWQSECIVFVGFTLPILQRCFLPTITFTYFYGSEKKEVEAESSPSKSFVVQAIQVQSFSFKGEVALDPADFGISSFKRQEVHSCDIRSHVPLPFGRTVLMEMPLWAFEQEDPHSLPCIPETLVEGCETRHSAYVSMARRSRRSTLGGLGITSDNPPKKQKPSHQKGQGQRQRKGTGGEDVKQSRTADTFTKGFLASYWLEHTIFNDISFR